MLLWLMNANLILSELWEQEGEISTAVKEWGREDAVRVYLLAHIASW